MPEYLNVNVTQLKHCSKEYLKETSKVTRKRCNVSCSKTVGFRDIEWNAFDLKKVFCQTRRVFFRGGADHENSTNGATISGREIKLKRPAELTT